MIRQTVSVGVWGGWYGLDIRHDCMYIYCLQNHRQRLSWHSWPDLSLWRTLNILDMSSVSCTFFHHRRKVCLSGPKWMTTYVVRNINWILEIFYFFSRKHGHWSSILKSFSNIFGSHQLEVWFSIILKSGFILHSPWAIIWFCLWPELQWMTF